MKAFKFECGSDDELPNSFIKTLPVVELPANATQWILQPGDEGYDMFKDNYTEFDVYTSNEPEILFFVLKGN